MRSGIVTGSVWATRRFVGLPGAALLNVRVSSGEDVVALDTLGCGVGEHVLITEGLAAATQFDGTPPIDALVIGSIDQSEPPADG
jgi:ethanolamine utilization protein EutN